MQAPTRDLQISAAQLAYVSTCVDCAYCHSGPSAPAEGADHALRTGHAVEVRTIQRQTITRR